MKFLHIADLHFGKIVHGYSMIEDQRHWAEAFTALVESERPDAVLIAGDVYDRSQPSEEAVQLLNDFLTGLSATGIPVLMVAGNHDSAGKLGFGRELFKKADIHIAGLLERKLDHVTFHDDNGPLDVWLMPYIFPASVRAALGLTADELPGNYEAAAKALLSAQEIDRSRRNVLLTHLNVTRDGQELPRENSETAIGGLGGIDYRVFDDFCYVALGHIHANACVGRESVRYAGTPLCYHFNETRQGPKGALLVEIDGNGGVTVEQRAIEPLHRMVELKGSRDEVIAALKALEAGAYAGVVLTDRRRDALITAELRAVAEAGGIDLMKVESSCEIVDLNAESASAEARQTRSAAELFADFYEERKKTAPSGEDAALMELIGRCCTELYGEKSEPSQAAVESVIDFIMKQEG